MNADDYYTQRHAMIMMADEIRELGYVIAELRERTAKQEKKTVWTEAELMADVGLSYE